MKNFNKKKLKKYNRSSRSRLMEVDKKNDPLTEEWLVGLSPPHGKNWTELFGVLGIGAGSFYEKK